MVNVSNFPAFAGAPGQVTPASGAFRLHLNCGDIRPEVVALPSDSDVWKTKMEYLNAMEKSIAQLEGRKPVATPGRVPLLTLV